MIMILVEMLMVIMSVFVVVVGIMTLLVTKSEKFPNLKKMEHVGI